VIIPPKLKPYGLAVISCASGLGSVKLKVAPGPELDVAHKRPPWDSIIDRLIESPIPVPSALVLKNALKILSA
jgi:hypothetical protein